MKNNFLFFNGCFDILTPGHIKFIQSCSQVAEERKLSLHCALDSDKKIKEDKGSLRPIFSFKERQKNLSILFPEINMFHEFNSNEELDELYRLYKPVLVKGIRWKNNVVGGKWAKEIIYISDFDSFSTTDIIERIRKKTIKDLKKRFPGLDI